MIRAEGAVGEGEDVAEVRGADQRRGHELAGGAAGLARSGWKRWRCLCRVVRGVGAELVPFALVPTEDREVGTMNATNGAVTLPGSPINGDASLLAASGVSTLDTVGNRYFFVGSNDSGTTLRLYQIDPATGGSTAINGLQYDDGEGVLDALASVGAGDRQLAAINPATGGVTLLGSPIAAAALSTTSGSDTLDASGDRYFFSGQPALGNWKIYSINTTNGAVLANPDLTGDSTTRFGLEWDPRRAARRADRALDGVGLAVAQRLAKEGILVGISCDAAPRPRARIRRQDDRRRAARLR